MKAVFTFLALCVMTVFTHNADTFAQQRPSTTGTLAVRPSTTGTVRPATTGTVRQPERPSTTGTVRPSTSGTVRQPERPSTTGTVRPSTTGTVRPDTTRPQPRDTVRPEPRDTTRPFVSGIIVRAFPNPASVRLVVGFANLPPRAERVTVRILTTTGEELLSETVPATQSEVIFDVSRLREGQYVAVANVARVVGRAVVIIRR